MYEFITLLMFLYVCLVNYTDQDEDDIKEFQRDSFNMITNRELGELKVH